MAHVGDVAHVSDLKAQVRQVAIDDVEGHKGTAVAKVDVAIDRRYCRHKNLHSPRAGFERFFLPVEAIVYFQFVLHSGGYFEAAKIRALWEKLVPDAYFYCPDLKYIRDMDYFSS